MIGMLRANKYCPFPLAAFLVLVLVAIDMAVGQQGPSQDNPAATFEQFSAQATSAREAGRVDDAIRYYQTALQLHPDWAEGWWYVGTLNYDADHYAEAIPALQRLLALSPQMGPALAFLGLSEFETRDYENSMVHLRQAQQQGFGDDPEIARVATYHLALLFNRNGEFEKAVETLSSAIELGHPPDGIKVVLGMALLRVPLLANEVDPGKDALIRAAGEAAVLLDHGKSAAAADALRQLLLENPKTPYLHYAYASALAGNGKYDDAVSELSEEIKVSSRSALPYVQLVSLDLQLHREQAALPLAHQAVLLAPQSAAAHHALAQTLKTLGRIQEATEEMAVATKLEANAVEVDRGQQQLYAGNGAERIPRPTASTTTGSEDAFKALAQKAEAAQTAGQKEATVSYYQRALALHPEWEEGWRNLGTSYYITSRYDDAVTAFKNAVAIDAHNGTTWALLGLSEFEIKDYKNSLIHLERGRNLGFAGSAAAVQVAKYHLAVLLNRNGQFDQAIELLTRESGSGPLEEQVKFTLGMALLRIGKLPAEVDQANGSLVRLAGETAALLTESKYDEAFSRFQQLLKMNSRTPYLHYAYGCALASISRYEEAEEQLAEETKITPGSPLPYLRRSTIALQLRHPENAARFAQEALQLASDSAEGHYLLGRSWLDLGKIADSVTELETARRLAPNSPGVHFALARSYTKAGRPDAAEQERAAFARLNELAQTQRSHTGSQAYGAVQDRNAIRATEGEGSDQGPIGSHLE